mgnify:CR=1 FL=1
MPGPWANWPDTGRQDTDGAFTFGEVTVRRQINVFSGQGGGWNDEVGVPERRFAGGVVPTFAQVGATAFWADRFAVNDEMWFHYHIHHDYVVGSAIYCHVHWFADGVDANTVRWEFTIAAAKGHGQETLNLAGTVLTVTQASGGSRFHMLAELADPGFSSASLEPDAAVLIRVRRITNGGVDNADPIFFLFSDLHYRSNGSPTKNKAPNFYA